MSLIFIPKVQINNIQALVQVVAGRRLGDKPLSEQKIANFPDIYASLGLNEFKNQVCVIYASYSVSMISMIEAISIVDATIST